MGHLPGPKNSTFLIRVAPIDDPTMAARLFALDVPGGLQERLVGLEITIFTLYIYIHNNHAFRRTSHGSAHKHNPTKAVPA